MLKSFELSLKKGEIGERICRQSLERQGWVVYQPITEGAHAFDMLAIQNKERAVAIDVKAKARLNFWRATGINQCHFEVYQAFSERHSMPFWLFFVDEFEKKIYGNRLDELEKPKRYDGQMWPLVKVFRNVPTRVWHLEQMLMIAELEEAVAAELVAHSQRSYAYEPSNPQ